MVTGLLLVAFAFFVVAEAAVLRNGGQSAADAAALAATHAARDELYDDFLEAIEEERELDDILAGEDFPSDGCDEAAPRLAELNAADLGPCGIAQGRTGYTVEVTTTETLGNSVVPIAEGQAARARATAVLEGLCEVTAQEADLIELSCEDEDWSFGPDDEDERPEARDLFRVFLED
jgi:hypothetical protein